MLNYRGTYTILKSIIKTNKNNFRGKHNILKDIMSVDKIKCILRPANVFSNNKNNKMRLESKHPNGILNAFERKTKVETDAF